MLHYTTDRLGYPDRPDEEQVSDCCGSELTGDVDDQICTECGEHAKPFEIDPEEIDYARRMPRGWNED